VNRGRDERRRLGLQLAGCEEKPGAKRAKAPTAFPSRDGSGAYGTLKGNKAHGRIGHWMHWKRCNDGTDSSAEQSLEGPRFVRECVEGKVRQRAVSRGAMLEDARQGQEGNGHGDMVRLLMRGILRGV
jgi:hypothetical protein